MSETTKKIALSPIRIPKRFEDRLELILRQEMKRWVFLPLVTEAGVSKAVVKNSLEKPDDLIQAIQTGRVRYDGTGFSGSFSASLSKLLQQAGAVWRGGRWVLPKSRLSQGVREASDAARVQETRIKDRLLSLLDRLNPKDFSADEKLGRYVDALSEEFDTAFQKSVRRITVSPTLSKTEMERIRLEYKENLKLTIKNWQEEEILRLRTAVTKHVFAGNRQESLSTLIQEQYGVAKRKANFLARQETSLVTAKLRDARYEQAGIDEYYWVAVKGTPAHPVRPLHQQLSDESAKGKVFRFSNPPASGTKGEHQNPGIPFNCFLPETKIQTSSQFRHVFKRLYEGPVVKISSESDVSITVTPNHPVLTLRGWVFAKDVNNTDQLLQSLNPQMLNILNTKVDNRHIPTADDVFNFFAIGNPPQRVATVGVQFHGDSVDQKIEVIPIQSNLSLGVKTAFNQVFVNSIFTLAYPSTSTLPTQRRVPLLFEGLPDTFGGCMSFPSLIDTFGNCHTRPLDLFCLGRTSNRNSLLDQPSANDVSRSLQKLRDLILTQQVDSVLANNSNDVEIFAVPGGALFKVITVTVSHENYSGYVYNFETEDNLIIANSLLTHNCRCVARPVVTVKLPTR